jgi:hypothetical protein
VTWQISVAVSARPVLRDLDPSLLEEVTERAAAIADDPLPELRFSGAEEPPGALVLEYESDVIRDLRVRLIFADLDLGARRIVLIDVRTNTIARDE